MKKILVFLVMLVMLSFAAAETLDQQAIVTIGEDIEISIDNVNFGTVYPGDAPQITVNVDNTGSNVDVTLESVALQNSDPIYNSLTLDGVVYSSFSKTFDAFGTGTIEMQITIPNNTEPGIVNNVIMYTVTGPTPPGGE